MNQQVANSIEIRASKSCNQQYATNQIKINDPRVWIERSIRNLNSTGLPEAEPQRFFESFLSLMLLRLFAHHLLRLITGMSRSTWPSDIYIYIFPSFSSLSLLLLFVDNVKCYLLSLELCRFSYTKYVTGWELLIFQFRQEEHPFLCFCWPIQNRICISVYERNYF